MNGQNKAAMADQAEDTAARVYNLRYRDPMRALYELRRHYHGQGAFGTGENRARIKNYRQPLPGLPKNIER